MLYYSGMSMADVPYSVVLAYLAIVTLRSLGLMGVALLAVCFGRMKSSAARHAMCAAVVAGMLALAVFTPLLPPLSLRVLAPATDANFDLPNSPPTQFASVPAAISQPPAPSVNRRVAWQELAVFAYLAGALAFLVRLAFSYLFTRRLVRASRAIEVPWASDVYESNWISVPLTVGWFRPKILLPLGWDGWSAEKLQAVMAHEGTHVRRGDWAIAVMAGFNRCIFWFNPLAWWLERRLAHLAELACDDQALLLVGTESYAQALLDMAAAVKAGQGRLVWEAMAMANVAEVRNRIERILDETRQIPKSLTRSRWIALIACSLPLIYVASVVQLAPAAAQQLPAIAEQATPRKGVARPPSAISEQMKDKQLSSADAALMEQHLASDPEDLAVRQQLIVYYFASGVRERRLSHIFWLIANHPESAQAVFASKGLTPKSTSLNDESDYQRAMGLWKQQAASASAATDSRVLFNAAEVLSQPAGDFDEAERILLAGEKAQIGNLAWRDRLARLYAMAIVGSAGDPRFPNPNPRFADRVKMELERSTDGALLQFTGRALASVAARPQPGQKLPVSVLNLDEHPMLTPVVEMGNLLLERSKQFVQVLPGDLTGFTRANIQGTFTTTAGIIGSVPSSAPPPPPRPLAQTLATAPTLIHKVIPEYPALARQARIQGDVKLSLQIGTDGRVERIEVLSAHPLLAASTLEAVKQWQYAPIPTAGTITIAVPFRLDGSDTPLDQIMAQQSAQQRTDQQASGQPAVPPRIRIGGAVQAAKLTSKVDPIYPEEARAAGVEGEVVLDVTIGVDGRVESARPTDGNPALATAAIDAVKQWVYRTTLLNGEPISVSTSVTVPFKLQ